MKDIKIILLPENVVEREMEFTYRYLIEKDGKSDYQGRTLKINRAQFPVPTEENDFRYGIFKAQFERWNESVATLKKADKHAFAPIRYSWDTTKPLFPGMTYNQFSKDFILARYNAKESQSLKSYK